MSYSFKDWAAAEGGDPGASVRSALTEVERRMSSYVDSNVGAGGTVVTADSASDLVAKVAAARAAGGGDVYVPDGTYTLTQGTGPVVIGTGVRLRLAPLAVITQGTGVNLTALVESYDYTAQVAANVSTAEHDFSIEGGTIDGNASTNPGDTIGVRFYAYRYTVRDVRITNCDGNGFWSLWNDSDASTPDVQEAHVDCLWISKCGDTGLVFEGPHDSLLSNINIGRITGGSGCYFSGRATGSQITNLHTWSTSAEYGIYCDTTLHFANCVAEGALLGQVYVNGTMTWTGGRVFDKDSFGNSAHKGFVWGSGGTGATIDGVAILECNEGAFDFTGASGSNSTISANVWHSRAAQSVVLGTPSDSVDFNLHVNFTGLSSVTGVTSTDTFTKAAHGLTNGWRVRLRSLSGGSGLATDTTYYVVNKTTDTFQLSLTEGGAAVDLGSDVSSVTVTSYLGLPSTTKRRTYTTRGRIAASSVGSVQGKIEVLDEHGTSLGFLPLYASIT